MEESAGTVLFDGQFWIFLLEKINQQNTLCVGKYTFGAEPSNTDLLEFYLNMLQCVPVYPSAVQVRIKTKKCIQEQSRITSKAKNMFKELQKLSLDERKKNVKALQRKSDEQKFLQRREKLKKKHKGR